MTHVPGPPGDDPEASNEDAVDTAADVAARAADEIAGLLARFPASTGDPSSKMTFTIEIPASIAAQAAERIRSRLPEQWRLSGVPGHDPEFGFHLKRQDVQSALDGVPGGDPE